jgi:spartin
MASSNDPRLLYSINNVLAFHLQDGEESSLTPSGPQTLSLLMVPTTTSPTQNQNSPLAPIQDTQPEDDFYLHLHLPPELDLALPATTQIYHQPPNSYLIPRWDLGPDAGAFIRIQFPSIGSGPNKVTQEDIDTFETILAQCTAFLERAQVSGDHAPYNPANFAAGEGYLSSPNTAGPNSKADQHGRIVLVDEENGSVVGEMEGYDVVENPDVKPGSKSKSCTLGARCQVLTIQDPSKSNSQQRVRVIKSASAMYLKNTCRLPGTPRTRARHSFNHRLRLLV